MEKAHNRLGVFTTATARSVDLKDIDLLLSSNEKPEHGRPMKLFFMEWKLFQDSTDVDTKSAKLL